MNITVMRSAIIHTEFGDTSTISISADIKGEADIELFKKFIVGVFGKFIDNTDVRK